jgi:molybdopterin-dependent oxidoreductase alpha subunit
MSTPNPHPPLALTGLKLGEPYHVATGVEAVISSFRHVFGQANLWRGNRALFRLNQKDGYDCPSCAWPDPDGHRSPIAEYCENGAKAIAEEATTHTASPVLFQRYSIVELSEKSDYWLGQQGRLTQPLVVREGGTHYEKISWEAAFRLIADELNALASPDEAIFYTSGRTSNEAAFLYQLFVRQFGTNNLPDCSNMCHESTGEALSETIGLGKASVKLDDFGKTELVVLMGQNPGTNHPRMLSALSEAKRAGAKLIAVNPLVEAGLVSFRHPQHLTELIGSPVKLTDLYLQVQINGDLPLLKAWLKLLLEAEEARPGTVFDQAFIDEKTEGYPELVAELRAQDLDELATQSGVPLDQIRQAADWLAQSKRIIFCWAMGLTQHKNAVVTLRELMNVLLLKGSIGQPGAGACPVRGHSNVQGDRTMGIYERPKPAFLDSLKTVFDFEPPRENGYDTVAAIQAMHEGRAKVFFAMGGNFLSATPDTDFTAEALRRCRLTVQVSTKLNRSHLIHGQTALILPCLGRSDEDRQASGTQFVSVENTTGVVHQSKGLLKPVSEYLKSEPAIVAELAQATLGTRSAVPWSALVGDYDQIRSLIEKTIPGFDNYNERVRQPDGFYLPNAPRERRFETESGRAKLTVNPLSTIALNAGEYLLATVRSHDQFNTTVYGLDDRYRGVYHERRVLFMNADDLREAGLEPYQLVDLHSHYDGRTRTAPRFVVVPYAIPRRNLAAYFPETNVLVPIDQKADRSHTPISKSVVVTLTPVVEAGRYTVATVRRA